MATTHSTPFLRQQALPVLPIIETEEILEDLEGLTLPDHLLTKHGYRTQPFTDSDLNEMRHCKTCGLRVSDKAEKRRRKPTREVKKREAERIKKRDEILEKKLEEVLPALKIREDNTPPSNPSPTSSSSASDESWESPWPTDSSTQFACCSAPLRSNSRLKFVPPTPQEVSGLNRTAWWHNDANKWVSFEFTIGASEVRLFAQPPTKTPGATCQSHSGRVRDGRFTCCDKSTSEPGCLKYDVHEPIEKVNEFRDDMKLFETPSGKATDERRAVALDCEMGISQRGEAELIWVAAVDFFTGEVLLDSLVYPNVPMRHLSTRFSGVNWRMLRQAKNTRKCLNGRDEARQRLFQWVGTNTIVVTHGGKTDFLALRWIHRQVVDTLEVESRRQGAEAQRTLSHLATVLLKRPIQKGRGHDCLEDTIACRDLARWYVDHLPDDAKKQVEDDSDEDYRWTRADEERFAEVEREEELRWEQEKKEKTNMLHHVYKGW